MIPMTKELAREIASNLGAPEKLIDVLIEKMWYSSPGGGHMQWSDCPNRDTAVVVVSDQLDGIWSSRRR